MQKRAPTLGNMLVIILFVLSCFGLLLFLWESFGGPLPLKPKGYRMTVAFPRVARARRTVRSAHQRRQRRARRRAEARRRRAHARAELEINQKYAPIRANMHAILRQKTLLGETYVQLIPQSGGTAGPFLRRQRPARRRPGRTVGHARRHPLGVRPEDAPRLPDLAAVGRRRDQRPRRTDQRRLRRSSNRSSNTPTRSSACSPRRRARVRALVKNTGVVFNALASRDHQLEGLIVNGEHTFHALRRRQPGVRRGLPRAADVRAATRASALKELDRFADRREPVPRRIPPGRAQALAAAQRGQAVRAAVRQLPDLARAADEGRQEGPAATSARRST